MQMVLLGLLYQLNVFKVLVDCSCKHKLNRMSIFSNNVGFYIGIFIVSVLSDSLISWFVHNIYDLHYGGISDNKPRIKILWSRHNVPFYFSGVLHHQSFNNVN